MSVKRLDAWSREIGLDEVKAAAIAVEVTDSRPASADSLLLLPMLASAAAVDTSCGSGSRVAGVSECHH